MEDRLSDTVSNLTSSLNITQAQVLASIIVGSVIVVLVVMNVVVYVSYKKAVKSFNKIMDKNKNMTAVLGNHLGPVAYHRGNNPDSSATSTTVSRANSRCSQADTLPRKTALGDELIENQVSTEILELKQVQNKSILKKHPQQNIDTNHKNYSPDHLVKTNDPRNHHWRIKLQKDYKESKHPFSVKSRLTTFNENSSMCESQRVKHSGHRLPLATQLGSFSIDNLMNLNQDSEFVKKNGSAEFLHSVRTIQVSLVDSDTESLDVSNITKNRSNRHRTLSPLVTDLTRIKMADSRTNRNKDSNSITLSAMTVGHESPAVEITELTQLERHLGENNPNDHKGDNLHYTRLKSDNSPQTRGKRSQFPANRSSIELTRVIPKGNILETDKVPIKVSGLTHVDARGSYLNIVHQSFTPSTKNKVTVDSNGDYPQMPPHVATPVQVTDFKQLDLEEATTNIKFGHFDLRESNSSLTGSPLPIRVTELSGKRHNCGSKPAKGSNSSTLRSVTCSGPRIRTSQKSRRGSKPCLEPNTSTDTINSLEVAMMADKEENYGDIQIVDKSSEIRLKRHRSVNEDCPVIEFQNLAFDTSEVKTELGTFYIGDIEL